jgi:hypothetical protein
MVGYRRWLRILPAGLLVAAALVPFGAVPAAAHGDGESEEAGTLVRQAIALTVNTPDDTMAIEDKIVDATEAEDQEGVDIELVDRAKDALDAGDMHRVRALLEVSIGARAHLSSALPLDVREPPAVPGSGTAGLSLATGDDPGGGLADDPLVARRQFDGRMTTMFGLSLLAIAVGLVLAVRYRPIRTRRLQGAEPHAKESS